VGAAPRFPDPPQKSGQGSQVEPAQMPKGDADGSDALVGPCLAFSRRRGRKRAGPQNARPNDVDRTRWWKFVQSPRTKPSAMTPPPGVKHQQSSTCRVTAALASLNSQTAPRGPHQPRAVGAPRPGNITIPGPTAPRAIQILLVGRGFSSVQDLRGAGRCPMWSQPPGRRLPKNPPSTWGARTGFDYHSAKYHGLSEPAEPVGGTCPSKTLPPSRGRRKKKKKTPRPRSPTCPPLSARQRPFEAWPAAGNVSLTENERPPSPPFPPPCPPLTQGSLLASFVFGGGFWLARADPPPPQPPA